MHAGVHERTAITIGVFDGVHLGHQRLVSKAVSYAREKSLKSVAITFDPLPEEFFEGKKNTVLTTAVEKKEILRRLGIDFVLILKFDESLASMDKVEFLRKVSLLNPAAIVVGEDFRFGKAANGRVEDIRLFFTKDAEVFVEPLLKVDGEVVKSSLIRNLIWSGDTLKAQKFLGRRYSVSGEVVSGRGIGRAIGFPTANVAVGERKVLPAPGVYSGFAEIKGRKFAAAIFVPPFLKSGKRVIEAHALEFSDDIYSENITVEFHEKVSEVGEFTKLEDLQKKIASDISRVVNSILLK